MILAEVLNETTVTGAGLSVGAVVFWIVKRLLALSQRVSRLEAKLGTKPPFEMD